MADHTVIGGAPKCGASKVLNSRTRVGDIVTNSVAVEWIA